MGCRICGRSSCTESFHSLEAIERFDSGVDEVEADDDEENEAD